jgi:hypothetical protein
MRVGRPVSFRPAVSVAGPQVVRSSSPECHQGGFWHGPMRLGNRPFAGGLPANQYRYRRRDSNPHGRSPTVFKSSPWPSCRVIRCSDGSGNSQLLPVNQAELSRLAALRCSLVISRFLSRSRVVVRQSCGSEPAQTWGRPPPRWLPSNDDRHGADHRARLNENRAST